MNARHLKIIAALVVLAGLLYAIPALLDRPAGRGSVMGDEAFQLEFAGEPNRLDVAPPDGETAFRLERESTGWTVDGHPADSSKIADLLRELPSLASDELVARNPANHATLGVASETGRRIDLYTESGGPVSFFLGDRDPSGGSYVRRASEDQVYRLDHPVADYLSRDRDAWRDRRIASVDTSAVREILAQRSDQGRTLVREAGGHWTRDGAPADSVAVQRTLASLASLSATGFPTDEAAREADFSEPAAMIDVFAESAGDVTGRELVLSLRMIEEVEGGDWLVRRADDSEVYRLSASAVDRLVPPSDDPTG